MLLKHMQQYRKITFILLYGKHIRFLIKKARCTVTRLYSHYTFKQDCLKRDFIIMNEDSRQKAKPSVENFFCNLMKLFSKIALLVLN